MHIVCIREFFEKLILDKLPLPHDCIQLLGREEEECLLHGTLFDGASKLVSEFQLFKKFIFSCK